MTTPNQPNPRFVRHLKNYLTFWLEKTAVIDDTTINDLNEEFPNLVSLLETAVMLTEARLMAAQLVLQCFFWIENAGHVAQWRPLVALFVEHIPASEKMVHFQLVKQLGQLLRIEGKYQEAIQQFQVAQKMANRRQDTVGEAEMLINLGQTFLVQRQYGQAQIHATNAKNLLNDQSHQLQALSHQLLGSVAYETAEFETAVFYFKIALTFEHPGQTTANMMRTRHMLTLVYRELAQYNKAFEIFKGSDDILAKTPYLVDRLNLKIAWGAAHYDLDELAQAEKQFQDALQLLDGQSGYALYKGHLYNNLACVYRSQKLWDEALLYFEHSIKIFTDINDNFQLANSRSGLAKLFELQNKTKEAIKILEMAILNIEQLPKDKRTTQIKLEYQKRKQKLENP